MLATQAFIRAGEVAPTLRLAGCLLGGPEDLIHKASGWMLRYAIERPPATVRARYLAVRGAARRRVAS